jgi:hypothetical protein
MLANIRLGSKNDVAYFPGIHYGEKILLRRVPARLKERKAVNKMECKMTNFIKTFLGSDFGATRLLQT